MAAHSNGVSRKRPLNDTFAALPTTVFTVMTNLANEHGSINLGQGFPDEEGPASMKARSFIRLPRPTAASQMQFQFCGLQLTTDPSAGTGGKGSAMWSKSIH